MHEREWGRYCGLPVADGLLASRLPGFTISTNVQKLLFDRWAMDAAKGETDFVFRQSWRNEENRVFTITQKLYFL